MPKEVHKIHDAIIREHPRTKDSRAWAIAWRTFYKEKKK